MKLPLPADFFAPVRLSSQETQELRLVEARLLTGYLASYDQYAAAQASAGPAGVAAACAESWKLVGQRDGVQNFSKRQAKRAKNPPPADADEHARLPGVRVVGRVDGALEELLYGSMWHSGCERRGRAQLSGDGVADAAMLCCVDAPTAGEPFRSLAVKWALRRGALGVKDRDVCYLSASGLTRSPRTGQRLGFRLRHSVSFPSCPPFQNRSVVRAQLYLCSFFRQLRHGRVHVFHQLSFDAGGGRGFGLALPRVVAERAAAQCLVSLADVRAAALAKKLARAGDVTRAVASLSQASAHEALAGERRCGMCLRRLGPALKRRCAACRHWTCAQCGVRHDTLTASAVTARCFCQACVAKVLRDDTTLYAVRDAQQRPQQAPGHGRWAHDDIGGLESDDGDEHVALDLPRELVPTRRQSLVLFAPRAGSLDADALAEATATASATAVRPQRRMTAGGLRTPPARLAAKQLSGRSEAVNTVDSSPPESRRRSATVATGATQTSARTRRRSSHAPDILLRSDVGQRNWASSASALALQSPQRTRDGSPVVHLPRRSRSPSVTRLSFSSSCSSGSAKSGELRVRMCTPRHPRRAASLPYFASAPATATTTTPIPRAASRPDRHRQGFRGSRNQPPEQLLSSRRVLDL